MDFPKRHHRITAKELHDWMHLRGISQTDLAKRTDYSRTTVYNWLEGTYSTPANLYDWLCALYGEPYPPEYELTALNALSGGYGRRGGRRRRAVTAEPLPDHLAKLPEIPDDFFEEE